MHCTSVNSRSFGRHPHHCCAQDQLANTSAAANAATAIAAQSKGFLEAEGIKAQDGTRADPPLAKFEEQIHRYRSIAQEVAALPSTMVVGFLRVSAKPLKASLTTWASKWAYAFTHYLQASVACGAVALCGAVILSVQSSGRAAGGSS